MKKYDNFKAALNNLKDIYDYKEPYGNVEIAGIVGLYEICFEQAWKAMKELLENYGYDVIDLGKDVPYQAVVDAVKENDVKLVGLSALMTTTLVSMKETIELLHENNLDCKVMVGGAVLTPEYAKEIHADFYAKDAKESVDIAKRVLG